MFERIRCIVSEPFRTITVEQDALKTNVYTQDRIKSIIEAVRDSIRGTTEFDSTHALAFKELRLLIDNGYLNEKAHKLLSVLFRGFNMSLADFPSSPVLKDITLKYAEFQYNDTDATLMGLVTDISIVIKSLGRVRLGAFDEFYSNIPLLINLYFPNSQ